MAQAKAAPDHGETPDPPADAEFAIVASRFNGAVVDALLEGALRAFADRGVPASRVYVSRVPGAWELPHVCARLCHAHRFDAVLALGAVIRGETPHFDYVASAAAQGCSRAMLDSGVPVVFGVLTTETMEQARARSGGASGNKGADAALCAIEMVHMGRRLRDEGL